MGARMGTAGKEGRVGTSGSAEELMSSRRGVPKLTGDPVFGFKRNQPTVWFHRQRQHSNKHCLYCSQDVSDLAVPSTKEHLIAREFVPTGTLDGNAFNFIFRACEKCNHRKSEVERHVSTVTLFISPGRGESIAIDALAKRKAKRDFHPTRKGIPVEDSHESFHVPFKMGPATGSFEVLGPPQFARGSVAELALRHVQGLFSLITSTDPRLPTGTSLLHASYVFHMGPFLRSDWGNAQLKEVVRRVQDWKLLGIISTAKGFFRAEFRRDETGTSQWFWALEWNKSTRVIGVIKKVDDPLPLFDDLPPLAWKTFRDGLRYRAEQRLASEDDDLLFRFH